MPLLLHLIQFRQPGINAVFKKKLKKYRSQTFDVVTLLLSMR